MRKKALLSTVMGLICLGTASVWAAPQMTPSQATANPAPIKALATADKLSDLPQVYQDQDFLKQKKEKVGGGIGIIDAKYAFPRTTATTEQAIKEIAWLTIPVGNSIGLHQHANNEDAYIIVQGTGTFTDSLGQTTKVGPGDVTLARPGNKHGLVNDGKEPLVILDVIAMNDTYAANHPIPAPGKK